MTSRPSYCSSSNLDPPVLQFSSPFPTITLLKGSQFKLQCLTESDLLAPEYSWSFIHQPNGSKDVNIPFTPLKDTDEALELNPVDLHHAGIYKCVVRGFSETAIVKTKRTFRISVFGKTGRRNNVNVSLSRSHPVSVM